MKMKKPILVVMAAGMGSRYGGLKQMDPVGGHGEVIMDYSLYDARRAGFERVIFIIKHSIEDAFKESHRRSYCKIYGSVLCISGSGRSAGSYSVTGRP